MRTPPSSAGTSSSASRTGTRVPRRIAGSAMSGGPTIPSTRLRRRTGALTDQPGEMAKKVDPKNRTIRFAITTPRTDSEHGADCSEQERRAEVDAADLSARAADRLHHPDLPALLADQRAHRVRDEHARRQQGEDREHVHQRGELLEQLLARV